MKKIWFLSFSLFLICFSFNAFAQEVILVGDSTSMVNVRGDIRLGSAKQLPGVKPKKTYNIEGYRIVIYRGDVKTEAQNVRSKFSKKYPKIHSFILFDSPTYYVRIGDFKTEDEAKDFLKTIIKSYPQAIIIEDQINVTL